MFLSRQPLPSLDSRNPPPPQPPHPQVPSSRCPLTPRLLPYPSIPCTDHYLFYFLGFSKSSVPFPCATPQAARDLLSRHRSAASSPSSALALVPPCPITELTVPLMHGVDMTGLHRWGKG